MTILLIKSKLVYSPLPKKLSNQGLKGTVHSFLRKKAGFEIFEVKKVCIGLHTKLVLRCSITKPFKSEFSPSKA